MEGGLYAHGSLVEVAPNAFAAPAGKEFSGFLLQMDEGDESAANVIIYYPNFEGGSQFTDSADQLPYILKDHLAVGFVYPGYEPRRLEYPTRRQRDGLFAGHGIGTASPGFGIVRPVEKRKLHHFLLREYWLWRSTNNGVSASAQISTIHHTLAGISELCKHRTSVCRMEQPPKTEAAKCIVLATAILLTMNRPGFVRPMGSG